MGKTKIYIKVRPSAREENKKVMDSASIMTEAEILQLLYKFEKAKDYSNMTMIEIWTPANSTTAFYALVAGGQKAEIRMISLADFNEYIVNDDFAELR